MDKIERILKIIASAVAISVPLILLAGYSYHLGTVMTFGLNLDLIPKHLADVLAESWYVGVIFISWILLKWPYFLSLLAALYVVFIAAFFMVRNFKKLGSEWVFREVGNENQGVKVLGITQWHWYCLWGVFKELTMLFLTPLGLAVLVGTFTVVPYVSGRDDAIKMIEEFEKVGCDGNHKSFTCIHLVDSSSQKNEVITKGILVSANQDRIAIFNNELEVRPLSGDYIIRKQKLD